MHTPMPFQKITRTLRHLARLRRILSVIFRNGFSFLFDKLKGLLQRESMPETGRSWNSRSASERLRNIMVNWDTTFVKLGQMLSADLT